MSSIVSFIHIFSFLSSDRRCLWQSEQPGVLLSVASLSSFPSANTNLKLWKGVISKCKQTLSSSSHSVIYLNLIKSVSVETGNTLSNAQSPLSTASQALHKKCHFCPVCKSCTMTLPTNLQIRWQKQTKWAWMLDPWHKEKAMLDVPHTRECLTTWRRKWYYELDLGRLIQVDWKWITAAMWIHSEDKLLACELKGPRSWFPWGQNTSYQSPGSKS